MDHHRSESVNRMKVLWLMNIMLPAFAQKHGLPYSNREGWLTGVYDRMQKDRRARTGEDAYLPEERAGQTTAKDITHPVCFASPLGKLRGQEDGVTFYSFQENLQEPEIYDASLEERFRDILQDFLPDMVHIFGTEFPHTLAMARTYAKPEQTLIGLQGLCYIYADYYSADLSARVCNWPTLRDLIRRDSIKRQIEKFRKRGEFEKEALRLSGHVTGRTEFDCKAAFQINLSLSYHHMNETMRSCFYDGAWERANAQPYRIFVPQGDTPAKGLHYVLKALPKLIQEHPETHLFVAGNSVIDAASTSKYPWFLRISAYGAYLRRLIFFRHLKKHVTMLGSLTAKEMREQYLKASVFVCPSSLENSPNALAEAMLLGVPCAASNTGGIPSMLQDGKEGRLFPRGNVTELATTILEIWDNPENTDEMRKNASVRARRMHHPDVNFARLLEIYRSMVPGR